MLRVRFGSPEHAQEFIDSFPKSCGLKLVHNQYRKAGVEWSPTAMFDEENLIHDIHVQFTIDYYPGKMGKANEGGRKRLNTFKRRVIKLNEVAA